MKNKYQFISIASLLSVLQSTMVVGQDRNESMELSLKPKECVVFKEGDKCYASVKVKWSSKDAAAVCLYRTPGQTKLECWAGVSEGQFSESLIMSEPVQYYLSPENSSEVLVRETLNLSWVYKKSSRPEHTWRLF